MEKVLTMTREKCLQTRERESTDRIPLVTTFNPHTTFIAEIARRNWNFLQSKERLAHIFNKPPLVAYRRPISLRDRLVSTKFKTVNNTPVPRGCEACGKPKCSWCKGINKTTTFTSSNNNKTFKIFHSVNCQSSWVIYIIECNICNLQYIGKSDTAFKLQVHPGREFMGEVTKEMEKHDVRIRRENVNVHRDQGIVERFNRTLSVRPFSYQYSREMNFASDERSREWVKRLLEVVSALNGEKTRLTGKRHVDSIKEKSVSAKSSTTYSRPVGSKEKRLNSSVHVRYLYAPGELEGGQKRATDPIWSLKVFKISRSVLNEDETNSLLSE